MQEDVEKELMKKREEAAPKLEALQRQYEEIVNDHDTWWAEHRQKTHYFAIRTLVRSFPSQDNGEDEL